MTIKDVIYPAGTPFSWKVTVNAKKSTIQKCAYYKLPEWAVNAKVIKVNEVNLQKQELVVTLE